MCLRQGRLFDESPKEEVGEIGPQEISVTMEVRTWLDSGAVVAVGVSGGKDSSAVAIRLAEYLDSIGHKGPRVLVHSDLGRVEWKASLPACERLAARLGRRRTPRAGARRRRLVLPRRRARRRRSRKQYSYKTFGGLPPERKRSK